MSKSILVSLLILLQVCFAADKKPSETTTSENRLTKTLITSSGKNSLKLIPVKLKLTDPRASTSWIFSADRKYEGPKEFEDLASIKKASLDRKFELCGQLALGAFSNPRFNDLKAWIANEALECFNQLYGSNSVPKEQFNAKLAKNWLDRLIVSPKLFVKEAAQGPLSQQYNRFLLNSIRSPQNPYRSEFIQEALARRDRLASEIKSELYSVISEIALQEQQKEAATYYAQKNSPPAPPVNVALPSPPKKWQDSLFSFLERIEFGKFSSDEEGLWQKYQEELKKNNIPSATKYGVELLNEYPSGVHADSLSDKLVSNYLSFIESSTIKGNDKESLAKSILSHFSKADPSRIYDWMKALHRRQDYQGTYYLSKKVVSEQERAPSTGTVLYLGGRSSQFLGEYKPSLKMFNQMIDRHGGMDESIEARFRAGLIHLRLKNWSHAEDLFWSVISSPNNKNYELASYYWLYRLYEKQNKNASELFKVIQEKYSLSYYGLKLLAEKNQGKINWKKQPLPDIDVTIWLTPEEKNSFDRANKLSQVGWFSSAQMEVNDLINPIDAQTKVVLARYFSHLFNYPAAIKLLTEAGNLNSEFKEPSVVEIGFPFPFKTLIEKEAQNNNLSPWLVVSLIRQESAFTLKAQSSSQAQGLMQMIGPTAKEVAQDLKLKEFQASDIYEPSTNIRFGSYYLAKVMKQFSNNVSVGLAAYNAGPFRLRKFLDGRDEVRDPSKLSQEDPWSDLWIEELPWLETNMYVKSILRNLIIYQLLEKGEVTIPQPAWKI